MELIQGYAKDGGAIGVDDLHRWPGSDAVGFLSETTSAGSVGELMKVGSKLTFPRHILIVSSTR